MPSFAGRVHIWHRKCVIHYADEDEIDSEGQTIGKLKVIRAV